MPILRIVAFEDGHRASPFGEKQLYAGVILGGEISRVGICENRLFLVNQLVKNSRFLLVFFEKLGPLITPLISRFYARDPTPLSGLKGHRVFDRPTGHRENGYTAFDHHLSFGADGASNYGYFVRTFFYRKKQS